MEKLSAYSFAMETLGGKASFSFGVDRSKSVKALRNLADRIEAGTVLLHKVVVTNEGYSDEFTTGYLVLGITEAVNDPA